MTDRRVAIEVAYALPEEQVMLTLDVEPGTTLQQAIEYSGLLKRFPEIDLRTHCVGVFGCWRNPGGPVSAGDRIEIYRPLLTDPKDARRRRAAQAQKTTGSRKSRSA